MKFYEGAEANRRFMPLLPTFARIDGRAFHSFTKGCQRPYDPALALAMANTTVALAKETNACMGYTQSDEITLAWLAKDSESQIYFDGRIQKMTSQLAAQATLFFYEQVFRLMPYHFLERRPTFDARVWQVPNRTEGANVFLWREWDATKNSISMAASAYYSDNELHGKKGREKQDMLMAKGINWNDYPAYFKRGVYVQKRHSSRPFSAEEIEKLPFKHQARLNPNLVVTRADYKAIDMPVFSTVANKEAVIFDGVDPIVKQEV